jgi:hypothetical protein
MRMTETSRPEGASKEQSNKLFKKLHPDKFQLLLERVADPEKRVRLLHATHELSQVLNALRQDIATLHEMPPKFNSTWDGKSISLIHLKKKQDGTPSGMVAHDGYLLESPAHFMHAAEKYFDTGVFESYETSSGTETRSPQGERRRSWADWRESRRSPNHNASKQENATRERSNVEKRMYKAAEDALNAVMARLGLDRDFGGDSHRVPIFEFEELWSVYSTLEEKIVVLRAIKSVFEEFHTNDIGKFTLSIEKSAIADRPEWSGTRLFVPRIPLTLEMQEEFIVALREAMYRFVESKNKKCFVTESNNAEQRRKFSLHDFVKTDLRLVHISDLEIRDIPAQCDAFLQVYILSKFHERVVKPFPHETRLQCIGGAPEDRVELADGAGHEGSTLRIFISADTIRSLVEVSNESTGNAKINFEIQTMRKFDEMIIRASVSSSTR